MDLPNLISHLGPTNPWEGIAYLASRVERLRQEKPSLLLAAGDMIYGNSWASLFQGKSVIELMNAMRFDAMGVGNHEFDFGPALAEKRFSEARFPVLGANVEGLPLLKPYVIKKLGGVKVAIIGVVTEDTHLFAHPRKLAGLKFISPEAALNRYLTKLREEADIIVVLSHLGHPVDRWLAEKVTGIDVIVGGHSHTKILQPELIGHTIVVQAWEHAKALGVLDLTVKDGKIVKFAGHLEEIKPASGKADKKVQQIVTKYTRQLDSILNAAVGETAVDLDGEQVRVRETNLGDLITDIMRQAAGADVAIINGGSIRASLPKGKIKMKDIYSVLPFDNYLVSLKLTGRQIKDALEEGISGVGERAGKFPQVSGLSFTYRRSAPPGSKIQEIIIGNQPLVLDKEYLVATNDFLAAGGVGYKVFAEASQTAGDYPDLGGARKSKNLSDSGPGNWLRDLVSESLKGQKTIAPEVQGRIKELD